MIVLKIKLEILTLLKSFYKGMFIKSASDKFLDNKASDYNKYRKMATKTKGYLTVIKANNNKEVVIPKGYVFKTVPSLAGGEYRYFSTEKSIIQIGEKIGKISIEAENKGSQYNVPIGSIKNSLVHIENVESYENTEDWLMREGSDTELDESFKERTLNTFEELANQPTAIKYKNIAESVEGVLYVLVDDMHPRGQGTIDIIVASYAGTSSESLLKDVEKAIEDIKGVYDNVVVKSAQTVLIDIDLTLYIGQNVAESNLEERAINYLKEYFKINKNRSLNKLYLSEIIYYVRSKLGDDVVAIKITKPLKDQALTKDKVIVLGNAVISIERV